MPKLRLLPGFLLELVLLVRCAGGGGEGAAAAVRDVLGEKDRRLLLWVRLDLVLLGAGVSPSALMHMAASSEPERRMAFLVLSELLVVAIAGAPAGA